ncbi:MAG: NAD(+)/NADH kinase [Haliangium ochraceum]
MRFGFLLKRGKPEARELAGELGELLRRKGCALVASEEDASAVSGARVVAPEVIGNCIDALVVLGGDGTFLFGAGLVADHGVPLFGVNLGNMGFITHFARAQAAAALESACDGRLSIDERMRLSVTLRSREGTIVETRNAVNDAVISQAAMARLLDFEARLDGEVVTVYKGDGLILATPTGSTAYNLAAGGPILTPNLEAMVLTPICPHTLTNRPLVVSARSKMVVTNVSGNSAQLTIDGQWGRALGPGESIEVRKAERPLRTYRGASSFFAILHDKLSWGERQS